VDIRANLARIKAGDVDKWLKESEEKFRCSHCGKPLPTSSFRKKCYHCGKELSC
jgi:Zn finger protein HypA/HybF involved in hydrogenase expression